MKDRDEGEPRNRRGEWEGADEGQANKTAGDCVVLLSRFEEGEEKERRRRKHVQGIDFFLLSISSRVQVGEKQNLQRVNYHTCTNVLKRDYKGETTT